MDDTRAQTESTKIQVTPQMSQLSESRKRKILEILRHKPVICCRCGRGGRTLERAVVAGADTYVHKDGCL